MFVLCMDLTVYTFCLSSIGQKITFQGKETILRVARELAETERDCGIDTSLDDYERSLKFGLVEVVYEWANGKVQCIVNAVM